MNNYDIDLSQITEISYDGQDLRSLVLNNQTVWNRPASDASQSIIQRSFPKTSEKNTTSYSGIDYLTDSEAYDNNLSLGSQQEMSQDGTIKSFNYYVEDGNNARQFNIVVLSRTNVDTDVWQLREIVNFGSGGVATPAKFNMNHDGSILAASPSQGIVKIFRWNGSSYTLDQSLLVSGCYSLKFSHTQNTLAVLQSGSVKVFSDIDQQFEQIGLEIPLSVSASLCQIEVADGSHSNTFLYGSLVFLYAWENSSGSFTRYEHTTANTWEKDIGEGLDTERVNCFKVDLRGEKIATVRRVTYAPILSFFNRTADGQWTSTTPSKALPYTGAPVNLLNSTYRSATARNMAASNNLERVYVSVTKLYDNNNYIRGAAYGHYICGVSDQDIFTDTQTSSISTSPLTLFLENSISYRIVPHQSVHDGVSCDASGHVMSYHNMEGGNNSSQWRIIDYGPPTPSYELNASRTSMFEGNSVVFTLETTDIGDSDIPYTITGIQSADILEPLTGNFNLVSSKASVTINTLEDLTTEGKQTMTLTLDNGQSSATVDIIDTSTTP